MAPQLRIVVVMDALFPVTKGGAERWFAALAGELARSGHHVTYVTPGRGARPPDLGFSVVELGHAGPLYSADGGRRVLPAALFGVRLGWWLRRHRSRYDAFYVHQTPLFSVLAARIALGQRRPWAVEWIEWWTREYWRGYAPGVVGRVGWIIQRAALLATPRATVFARTTEERLRDARPGLRTHVMPGQLIDTAVHPADDPTGTPLVLVVGRLVPEKHPEAAIEAVAALARRRPVRARIIGQGPLLDQLRTAASRSGADIEVCGPVDQQELDRSWREASVLLHPSEREGFGLVVAEAAARGVPVVVVAGPDNAATELVEPGVNGVVSATRRADDLSAAVSEVLDAGPGLRRSTAAWFVAQAGSRSVARTAAALVDLLSRTAQAGTARK
jgi:glycosyltransferase involved in cell wall biosynthesis